GRYRINKKKNNFHKAVEVNNYRVLSLTENYNDCLMWSHYATTHNGIVCEFEINKCNFLSNAKKIKYVNKMPSSSTKVENLLVHKHTSWKYAKEYRVIVRKELSDFRYSDGNYYNFDKHA